MSYQALLPFLRLFAGPISTAINTFLNSAAAAFVAWQIAKGVPADAASNIAGGLFVAISTVLNALAQTIGVKINVVNTTDNGVKVVPENSPGPMVSGPLR